MTRWCLYFCLAAALHAAELEGTAAFTRKYCTGCHNTAAHLGGLDLTTLTFEPGKPANFNVLDGENTVEAWLEGVRRMVRP